MAHLQNASLEHCFSPTSTLFPEGASLPSHAQQRRIEPATESELRRAQKLSPTHQAALKCKSAKAVTVRLMVEALRYVYPERARSSQVVMDFAPMIEAYNRFMPFLGDALISRLVEDLYVDALEDTLASGYLHRTYSLTWLGEQLMRTTPEEASPVLLLEEYRASARRIRSGYANSRFRMT